jgi:hypothetical protein
MAQIVVKVDERRAGVAVATVRGVLEREDPALAAEATIAEVFPGLRAGSRAGMVTVEVPDRVPVGAREALLDALRAQEGVEYAELAGARRPR